MVWLSRRKALNPRRKPRRRVQRRRVTRALRRVPRPIRPNTRSIFIKRNLALQAISLSTAATSGFWNYTMTNMSLLSSRAELYNVFQKFRINAVKYTYYPRFTQADQAGGSSTSTLYVTTCIDKSNTLSTPTGTYSRNTLNILMENPNCKTRRATRPFSVYYKPATLTQDTGGSGVTTYKTSPWLDATTLSDGINHRGHHVFLWDPNFGNIPGLTYTLEVMCTLYLEFKGIH